MLKTRFGQKQASAPDFLTADSVYSVRTTGGPTDPDKQTFSAGIASRYADSDVTSISNFTAAPTAAGCEVAYQMVAYFPGNCAAVRSAHFGNFATKVEFGDVAELYTDENAGASLYLMPAGQGCVTIKAQLFH